jgi:hypothetical protein
VKKIDECDPQSDAFSSELTLVLSITSDLSGNTLDKVADLVESGHNELIKDCNDITF